MDARHRLDGAVAGRHPGRRGTPVWPQIVKDTDGAIGYVDFSDAKAIGLTFAAIKNKAGKFVAPTLEGGVAPRSTARRSTPT